MKRWDSNVNESVEDPKVDAFLDELLEVCRRHGMSLGHQDGHGSFLVYKLVDEFFYGWLRAAAIEKEE
jgi:hypothetical protein